ncbi:MAG: hypothetical protein IT229_05185 [Flavobacteriales bacterium]|nr:hypothetical protein [Flavobacteriales bacterium]
MNTRTSLRHLVWGVLVLAASHAQGQATLLGHIGGTGDHLGWNAATLQALEVRHDGNWPIGFYTNAIQKMRLNANPAGANINGYTGTLCDGFLLLSGQPDAFTNAACDAPFTRLHLVDPTGSVNPINYAQEFGFRPWQKNGVTFTGNSDQGYIGQKYNSNDATDMVIQWSDNPSTDPWA